MKNHFQSLFILCLLASVLLAACGREASPAPQTPGPTPSPTPSFNSNPDPLAETEWLLVSLNGQPLIRGTRITLSFEDGRMGGTAGCNSYGSPYTISGGRLAASEIVMTAMLCGEPEGVMEQEQAYVDALFQALGNDAGAYAIVETESGPRLEIAGLLGSPKLVYARQTAFEMDPGQLTGSSWQLASVDGLPPVTGSQLVLAFLNQREFLGFAGCRYFYGSYQAGSGDDLSFYALSMMGQDCSANEALNRQEHEFTDLLSQATDFYLDGDQLHLLTAQGKDVSFLRQANRLPAEITGLPLRLLALVEPAPQIGEGERRAVEPLPGSEITLTLGEDGQATGSAGCNSYFADYTLKGQSLAVGAPGATRMACAAPEGVMQQESTYLNLLPQAQSAHILAGLLWIETSSGSALVFRVQ